MSGLEICDLCHKSGYVRDGESNFVPATEEWFRQEVSPVMFQFICKDCVEKRKAN